MCVQTDRRADHNTLHPYWGLSNNCLLISSSVQLCPWKLDKHRKLFLNISSDEMLQT